MERLVTKIVPVEGYEGLYIIDDLGNVVSLPKRQGRYIHNKYHVLSQKTNRNGYVEVTLTKDGKMTTFLLHRLLARAFLPNPNNLPVVNHINGIKHDNRIENLEWCSTAENTQHAFANNLSEFQIQCMGALAKVNLKTMYSRVILSRGEEVHEFNSAKDAAQFLETHVDNITRAIRKAQRCRGYMVHGIKPDANGET